MSKRKFKNMYYRGTIEKASDFPKLKNRREGMFYGLYYDGVIADPELGTDTTVYEHTETYTLITTNEGHKDPDSEGYKKITGVSTDFQTNLKVGSEIIINNETRYVEGITNETEITLNIPLSNEIVEEDDVDGYFYRNILGETKLIEVDDDHATNKKLYGTGTAFLTDHNSGDEIIVLIGGGNVAKRIIDSIESETELTLNTPFVGDLSAINKDETYSEGVPYIVSKTGFEIDQTVYENEGRMLLWTETPDGYKWLTLAGTLV